LRVARASSVSAADGVKKAHTFSGDARASSCSTIPIVLEIKRAEPKTPKSSLFGKILLLAQPTQLAERKNR
jgi:hypothetical protein